MDSHNQSNHIEQLITAFHQDSFSVDREKDVFDVAGKIGIRATHQYATIGNTGKKKKAFYVEGNYKQMGHLLGLMAEPEIAQLCTTFNKDITLAFMHPDVLDTLWLREIVHECLELLLDRVSDNMLLDVPINFKDELRGIKQGCDRANPRTKVEWPELWVLNVGIDALLSRIYSGVFTIKDRELSIKIEPGYLRIPVLCNTFSVFGSAVENDGHFLGQDFVFPTPNVFQHTAALIIQNPDNKQPFVSVTAPGMIGSVVGMNAHGIGVGVNVAPSGNCNPKSVGLNSSLLARHSIERARTCQSCVDFIVNAWRGMPWLYVVADGTHQQSCVVEAGHVVHNPDVLEYVPMHLRKHLPTQDFLHQHRSAELRQGAMMRWSDYVYPVEYLQFNPALFEHFDKEYDPTALRERGYIDKSWRERNCPAAHYFAPQRENLENLVLATNMYIVPEMRLQAMRPSVTRVAAEYYDDVQWRYDALNDELVSRIKNDARPITFEEARNIIDFLAPYGKYPDYYNPDGEPLERVQIPGAVSLMDLRAKKITSHYGYYADEWVTIHLSNYVHPE